MIRWLTLGMRFKDHRWWRTWLIGPPHGYYDHEAWMAECGCVWNANGIAARCQHHLDLRATGPK